MRRSGDVHYVHIRIVHEIPPVSVGLKLGSELLHALLHGVVKMVPVHITDGDQTAALIACEMKATHAYSACPDDSACQLITGSDMFLIPSHGPEHVAWQDGKERQPRRRLLQKTSSGFTHSAIVIKLFPTRKFTSFFPARH